MPRAFRDVRRPGQSSWGHRGDRSPGNARSFSYDAAGNPTSTKANGETEEPIVLEPLEPMTACINSGIRSHRAVAT